MWAPPAIRRAAARIPRSSKNILAVDLQQVEGAERSTDPFDFVPNPSRTAFEQFGLQAAVGRSGPISRGPLNA
jgi:hypothetical protein